MLSGLWDGPSRDTAAVNGRLLAQQGTPSPVLGWLGIDEASLHGCNRRYICLSSR